MLLNADDNPGRNFPADFGFGNPGVGQQPLANARQFNRQNIIALANLCLTCNLLPGQALHAHDFQLPGYEVFAVGDDVMDNYAKGRQRREATHTRDYLEGQKDSIQKANPSFCLAARTAMALRFIP